MARKSKSSPMPWGPIGILFAIGVVFLFLGNIDRLIWSATRHGEHVSGRVVDMHIRRTQSSDTYLTYIPRVAFTDPGGVEREMSVKKGSVHYDFRKGERVTVLWRPVSQTIAIDIPFQRHFGTSIVMWVFTLVGAAGFLASIWFTLGRFLARKRKKNRSV